MSVFCAKGGLNIMLKFTKIMIFAIIYVVVNICATLLYSFLIGGYPSVLFYLIIGIISLGMIIFLYKKIIKIEKVVCILIVGATMLLMNQAYLFTNSTFDSNEYTARYCTELSIGRYIVFTDPNGDEKIKSSKITDDYDDGDSVIVEEYPGLFGVEHYVFIKQKT